MHQRAPCPAVELALAITRQSEANWAPGEREAPRRSVFGPEILDRGAPVGWGPSFAREIPQMLQAAARFWQRFPRVGSTGGSRLIGFGVDALFFDLHRLAPTKMRRAYRPRGPRRFWTFTSCAVEFVADVCSRLLEIHGSVRGDPCGNEAAELTALGQRASHPQSARRIHTPRVAGQPSSRRRSGRCRDVGFDGVGGFARDEQGGAKRHEDDGNGREAIAFDHWLLEARARDGFPNGSWGWIRK
jgi:hypothetical protein